MCCVFTILSCGFCVICDCDLLSDARSILIASGRKAVLDMAGIEAMDFICEQEEEGVVYDT